MDNDILNKLNFLKENCKSGYADIYYILEYTINDIGNTKSAVSEEMRINTQATNADTNSSNVTETNEFLTLAQNYIQSLEEMEGAFVDILDKLSDEKTGILKPTHKQRKWPNS